jgi:hypothetical protein
MTLQKRIFSKLSDYSKKQLSKQKKVDLSLGENLQTEIDIVKKIYQDLNDKIDESFVPVREIEKLMSEVNADIDISSFIDALQSLEESYNIEADKLREAENDLGITIPRPAVLDNAVNEIAKLQDLEEQVRADVNEYNNYLKMLFN